MAIKWSSKKPAEDLNGLEALHDEFMQPEPEDVVVIAIARRAGRHLPDGDEPYPEVRFARIEPVLGADDKLAALAMVERAYQARTHNEALDMPEVDA